MLQDASGSERERDKGVPCSQLGRSAVAAAESSVSKSKRTIGVFWKESVVV
jgi:hypothetical protein